MSATPHTEIEPVARHLPALRVATVINQWARRLVGLAIFVFLGLGTAASLAIGQQNPTLARTLVYLPVALLGVSVPFSLIAGWLLVRERLLNRKVWQTMNGVSVALPLLGALTVGEAGFYFGCSAFVGLPIIQGWSLKAFWRYMQQVSSRASTSSS